MHKTLAPICLFTYNRLEETKQTIEALKNNSLALESDLHIFSDGPISDKVKLKVDLVRDYLQTITGFKSILIYNSKSNKGLANSIIDGVSQVIQQYGKVIVMEDDLLTAPNFLIFMNQALKFYENQNSIQSINGFSLRLGHVNLNKDVYFQTRPFPWGWATWSDRWDKSIFDKQQLKKEVLSNNGILEDFKMACGNDIVQMLLDSLNDKNDSWYVRWTYGHFKSRRFSVFPKYSLVENIGYGETGTHCKSINPYYYDIDKRNHSNFNFPNFSLPSESNIKEFLSYFSLKHKILIRLKLLRTAYGRKQLITEIAMTINKQ